MKLQVMLCSGETPYSKAIRAFTNSNITHTALVNEAGMVVESREPYGVRLITLDYYRQNYQGHVWLYDIKDEPPMDAAWTWSLSQLGEPYNYGEIAAIVWKRFTGLGVVGNDMRSWVCSQFTATGLMKSGVVILPEQGGFVTPKDIADSPRLILGEQVK